METLPPESLFIRISLRRFSIRVDEALAVRVEERVENTAR